MSVSPTEFLNNDNQRELVKQALIQEASIQLIHKLSKQPDYPPP
jgi:hypothetical protein